MILSPYVFMIKFSVAALCSKITFINWQLNGDQSETGCIFLITSVTQCYFEIIAVTANAATSSTSGSYNKDISD